MNHKKLKNCSNKKPEQLIIVGTPFIRVESKFLGAALIAALIKNATYNLKKKIYYFFLYFIYFLFVIFFSPPK